MKLFMCRITAIVLSVVMLLSLIACNGGQPTGQQATPTAAPTAVPEPVTITMLFGPNEGGGATGIQTNTCALEIEKQTGVKIDIIIADENKFKLMITGGDLPDVMYTNPTTQGQVDFSTLITGGSVIPLDDLIAQYGPDLQKQTTILQYARQFKSNGTNKVYFLPIRYNKLPDGQAPIPTRNGGEQLFGRWDLYKQIGAPEINSEADLISALKAMQDVNPKTEDGKKVYALSGWADWGLWPFFIPPVYGKGYYFTTENVYYSRVDETYDYLYLLPAFWEGMSFFNKAYRAGILDPEGFTMKFEQYDAKVKSGQVLTMYAGWWLQYYNNGYVQSGKNWSLVPMKTSWPYVTELYNVDYPIGANGIDHGSAITKNCKNPEAAMKLLNYLHSEAGAILNNRGVEGKHWEYVNGKPQWTKARIDGLAADPEYLIKEGIGMFSSYVGLESTWMCADGSFANFELDPSNIAKTLTAGEKEYCDFYKVTYPGEILDKWVKEGAMKSVSKAIIWPALTANATDATKKITSLCEEYIRVAAVQAMMAKDDAEFNKLKEEAIAGLKSRGIDTAMVEYTKIFNDAKAAASSFNP